MTALSDYNPQTHDPRPVLLVAPWESEQRAKEDGIKNWGGVYVTGRFDEIHGTRSHHVVIDEGHPRRYRFERDLLYTEIDESFDCYDEIQKQWSNGQ